MEETGAREDCELRHWRYCKVPRKRTCLFFRFCVVFVQIAGNDFIVFASRRDAAYAKLNDLISHASFHRRRL